jgi:lipoprotein-anchoring transpeptidase ErfK/SrfK
MVGALACSCVAASSEDQPTPQSKTREHAPIPLLHAHGIRADRLDPVAPVKVSVSRGQLHKVWVSCSLCDKHRLRGHVVGGGKAWQSYHAAPAGAKIEVAARARDRVRHMRKLRHLRMRVASSDSLLSPTMSPASGTFGVGQPIIIYFNHPVQHKNLVESRLDVKTDRRIHGAWHWMTDDVVHWRPRTFWPVGTHVSVSADLGDRWFKGQWGAGDHHTSFSIGDSHISTVDVAAHTMVVRDNGAVVRTIPVSTGREDQYPTAGGVHIALSKAPLVTMDSATVGIPRNSPDGYYEKVYWDVRISNGGEFVHAAPWSVADQGTVNVSHGCVNISTTEAQWFYGFSQVGDVVDVVNSARPPDLGDAGMADWNISWKDWKAGSAL